VTACCQISGQFLPLVLIFRNVNKKEELANGLLPGPDVYMNGNSPYLRTDLLIKWFTQDILKHKNSGKVIQFLDVTELIATPLHSFRLLLK
jgi:hypothetical protein